MDKEIKTENQTLPAAAGQVEFGVRPDVPEVNFGGMPNGAVYTRSLGTVPTEPAAKQRAPKEN